MDVRPRRAVDSISIFYGINRSCYPSRNHLCSLLIDPKRKIFVFNTVLPVDQVVLGIKATH